MDYKNYKDVKVEIVEGNIAKVYLNRPEKMNAINSTLRRELEDAMKKLAEDDSIRVVILTGAEIQGKRKSFCSGDDLVDPGFSGSSPTVLSDYSKTVAQIFRLFNLIDDFPKPVIAMVNGLAIGGGVEMALCCDFIFASKEATFSFPQINLGMTPAWGATQRLTRKIGESRAKRLIFTCETIDAETAKSFGIVDEVLPAEKLEEFTINFAKKIAEKNPLLIQIAKFEIEKGKECSLQSGLYYEVLSIMLSIASGELKEAVQAFFEKRKPEFKMK
ncbi:MAG: enoyl-CoA hydratase/isomerase family protein [Archaeoglobaceae archaeon]|nr:enoyl-CoA hydratase/isomerase family protein [Archaeoglobaceae archaeon]MDW8128534.1 enoyl-CoA hydratase/isomerase family protein [Archaeoglobaceae archaeon]